MMPMSPTDAQLILKGAEVSGEDLGIGYRRALETIAGMHTKYGVEVQRANGDWLPPYSWHDSPEQARNCVTAIHGRGTANRRIVRRYVTTPEEIS